VIVFLFGETSDASELVEVKDVNSNSAEEIDIVLNGRLLQSKEITSLSKMI
ncbi:TPA: hypothetical protein VJZ59_001585, partial [Streptococcus pyogenes]|nr:hypothetical protein [Streptococcus pyogenes]